jgi:hypothetical protein
MEVLYEHFAENAVNARGNGNRISGFLRQYGKL